MKRQKKSADTSPLPRSVIAALIGVLFLSNLFVFAFMGAGLYQSRQQFEERGQIATENLAKALELDLADQIGKIDLALFSLAQEYARQQRYEGADLTALKEAASTFRTKLPEVDVLSITNAQGDVIVNTDAGSDITLNVGDRDYFTRLKNLRQSDALVVVPVTSRLSGHQILMFARRMSKPDGSFGGIVLGGFLIARLQQQFASLNVGKTGIVALRDSNMALVTRFPTAPSPPSDIAPATVSDALLTSLEKNPSAATFVGISSADHVERLISYRRIEDYPLIVFVGLGKEEYLSGWHDELVKATILAFLFFLISTLAARIILSSWRRQLVALGQLNHGEERLRLVADHASDTISRLDPDGIYIYVSHSILPTTGYTESDVLGRDIADFIHPDDRPLLMADKTALLRRPETRTITYRFRRKDGQYVWLEFNVRPVLASDGTVLEFVAVSRDITARMQAAEQIEFLAHHDPLTGLPNRLLAKDRMEVTMARANRGRGNAALLFLDLDHFKKINDSLGHPMGDELLTLVANRLRDCLRETDTLCRQGGDEFLILLGDIGELESTSLVAETILSNLGRPFRINGQELSISASIGIAIYPNDGTDFDTLSRRADIAMYHAKEMGRNAYRFFAEQMNVDNSEYLRLRNGLRKSLERGQLLLHFQPQFDLRSGEVVGIEALIRWNHPESGLIMPARFIPVAEESGLIVPLGAWVLKEACRQAAIWRKAGLTGLIMAVNLSAVQFKRGNLLQTVKEALTESGLPPHCLELELTESILISDTNKILMMVDQLSELGVKLSIDDFGTGYSCLAYLKRFRVDRLKIDQSFVRQITTDSNDGAIVKAIIQLAHSLGLRTVAEGVEDEAAQRFLLTLGCDDAQGYHFGKPMPAVEIESLLRARKKAPAQQA